MFEKYKDLALDALEFCFDGERWKHFFQIQGVIIGVIIAGFLLWMSVGSLIVAPFYSITKSEVKEIKIYDDLEGKTTVKAVQQGIDDLLDAGLVTNFMGVNNWIDNKPNEQIGELRIYRIAMFALENNLCRNRGSGGANKNLTQARADIYADYELPMFTSYTTRLKSASKNIDAYLAQLEKDKDVSMNKKTAVFVVNSDNLAEVLDKLKQDLQSMLAEAEKKGNTITTVDDYFYKIRGMMIGIYKFLDGVDYDFKNKMIDKSSYNENFIPIKEHLKQAIDQNHLIVLETFGHLSKISKDANVIAQKLGELRDKLKKG